MKKYIYELMIAGLCVSAVACSNKTEPSAPADAGKNEQNAPGAQAPSENPAAPGAQAPSENPAAPGAQAPSENPKVPAAPSPAVLPSGIGAVPPAEGTVCESAEGCQCGETLCPMNAVCFDNVCKCGETLVEPGYTGYSCWEIAKGVYDLGCTESNGCPCGKIKVYSNMGCSGSYGTCAGSPVSGRGLACRHKPYQDKFYSLWCFNDECDCYGETIKKDEICEPLHCINGFKPSVLGCACDGRKYEDGYICVPGREQRFVNYCTQPGGCPCGEENTCPQGTVCRKNTCVDRYTLHELPAGFELVHGLPTCKDESTCICSNKKGKTKNCKLDQVCLNNYCYNNPNFRKFGDVTYYYIMDAKHDGAYDRIWNLMFIDENTAACSLFEHINESDKDICAQESNRALTVADIMTHCGTAEIPDEVKVMYCTLSMDGDALVLSGWHK